MRTSPRSEHQALGIGNPVPISLMTQNKWPPMVPGSVGTDEDDLQLKEQIAREENRLDGSHQVVPDVLKQLLLPDSKLKQNQKVLREFEEHRLLSEQLRVQDSIAFDGDSNVLDEVMSRHKNSSSSSNCSQRNELDGVLLPEE